MCCVNFFAIIRCTQYSSRRFQILTALVAMFYQSTDTDKVDTNDDDVEKALQQPLRHSDYDVEPALLQPLKVMSLII
jgi:hypothetical protein